MHQNSWRPGLTAPPQELHPWLSPSGFELRPSPRPHNVDFVATPLVHSAYENTALAISTGFWRPPANPSKLGE